MGKTITGKGMATTAERSSSFTISITRGQHLYC